MTRAFLLPGDLRRTRSASQSDHRQVLRRFINAMTWGAVATGVALVLAP
jgi:hypothetical protein